MKERLKFLQDKAERLPSEIIKDDELCRRDGHHPEMCCKWGDGAITDSEKSCLHDVYSYEGVKHISRTYDDLRISARQAGHRRNMKGMLMYIPEEGTVFFRIISI